MQKMHEKVKNNNDFYLFANTFSKMKYVSNIVFFKLFTKTTCKNLVYYAVFGSSRLQKRVEYGENGRKRCFFLLVFEEQKTENFIFSIDNVCTNSLNTPYIQDVRWQSYIVFEQ